MDKIAAGSVDTVQRYDCTERKVKSKNHLML